jgi:hypothetical protein
VTLGSNFLTRSREETLTSYTFVLGRATCFTAKTLLFSASSTALGEGIPSRRRASHFKIDREETRLEGEAPIWHAVRTQKKSRSPAKQEARTQDRRYPVFESKRSSPGF